MPFKHSWYIDGQVIYAEIWGEQTIEELKESNIIMTELLDTTRDSERLVHIIVNDEKLTGIPVSISQSQKMLTYVKHPKLGWVIMTGEKEIGFKDSIQNYIMTFVAKLARMRYIRVKTMQEALTHLKSVDQNINWDAVHSDMQAEVSS